MAEEIKRRGRPPGTTKKDPKTDLKINMNATTYEPKKRGRKAKPQTETPVVFVAEVSLDGEIEGTTPDKLKNFAKQVVYMDFLIDKEPYRMDLRMKRNETIKRMFYLIETL